MLMAYVMLGMQFNISMWYKLSGKTNYAVWITLAGLLVTIIINVVFMPRYSYHAAAWAHIASYLVMMVISLILGNKLPSAFICLVSRSASSSSLRYTPIFHRKHFGFMTQKLILYRI